MMLFRVALLSGLLATFPIHVGAQTDTDAPFNSMSQPSEMAISTYFEPRPTSNTRFDFTTWDRLLKGMVLYGGPSLRQRARRPDPGVGSRLVFGHKSPYRLEGNRIVFERFDKAFEADIADYVSDLVEIGNRLEIPALYKDEQLSYWLNLHNALVIQSIAEAYPIVVPSEVENENGQSFHDIDRVSINGFDLSLRDIRERIVYTHWSDPIVIYGFFHGDIGSPSIQRAAYSGETLRQTLVYSAKEFVNSLRAFHVRGDDSRISKHFQDAAPYFFPDFEPDLKRHLSQYMDAEVLEELESATGPLHVMTYAKNIADLTNGAGDRHSSLAIQSVGDDGYSIGLGNSTIGRALREHREKFIDIKRRGLSSTVTIEDIETESISFSETGNMVN